MNSFTLQTAQDRNAAQYSALLFVLAMLEVGWILNAADATRASYHELRIYPVTSNKMDGVLERFRDTLEPVRRKHGMTTIGYWSAPDTTK